MVYSLRIKRVCVLGPGHIVEEDILVVHVGGPYSGAVGSYGSSGHGCSYRAYHVEDTVEDMKFHIEEW